MLAGCAFRFAHIKVYHTHSNFHKYSIGIPTLKGTHSMSIHFRFEFRSTVGIYISFSAGSNGIFILDRNRGLVKSSKINKTHIYSFYTHFRNYA